MHSRIETLLDTFKLHHRIFVDKISEDMFKETDNEVAQKILEEKIEEIFTFEKSFC